MTTIVPRPLALRLPVVFLAIAASLAFAPAAFATSLRFHGNASGDIDRVKIAVDDPANANPGPPADVGAADFTLEFWMKAAAADNTTAAIACGANKNWKNGNVVLDRDRTGADRTFGVAIAGGKIVFGVSGDGTGDRTLCGASNVLDSRWHHVAVERRRSDGWMWIFVDGVLEAQVDGPDGDVSYPDDATAVAPNDPFLVVGAEKFDAGAAYDGSLDELRLSSSLRYRGGFTRPHAPFVPDAQTAALYHFDEGTGGAVGDSSGASGGPSNGTLAVGGSPSGPEWKSEVAPLGGLPSVMLTALPGVLSSPVNVTNAHDGTGRLFVVEQTGTIRIYENGALLATPFLDVSSLITCCGEEGLLSVAFHPDYASNGYFYVYYVNNLVSPGDITIARYSVSSGNPDVADPSSALILLVIPHPVNTNHYGGQLFFSPADGYLYAGTGDGGSGGDPPNNAQNLQVMLGKILRIDVDGTGAVPCGQANPMPYAIPPSNPFAGSDSACNEIWAYGVRNPWRYSFDRTTSDFLIGDVGQDLYEEIDFQLASSTGGENYGWRKMEGFHCYNPATNCNDGTLTLPVLEEPHTAGWCAIIGGYRYRGTAIPGLVSTYTYSDNCLGDIYAGTEAGDGSWTAALLESASISTSSFGEDEPGELYVCDLGGKVYRIDPSPYPAPSASSLSPAAVIAGGPQFTLTVNGSGFVYGSVVRWNGSDRPTTFVSGSRLTAAIPLGDIAGAGTAAVTVFTPTPGGGTSGTLTFDINLTFLDVPTTYFAYLYIQAVYNAGVTAGCGVQLFCPDASATRAQMAVFLLKASQTSSYTPPPCTGTVFLDVPCSGGAFDPWIEDLARRGITGGCGNGNYCPDASVTRAQMSAFLLKTEHGSSYVPPACSQTFDDVVCPSLFADWIQQLAAESITAGCGGNNYCPAAPVTRGQMAVFLTKTFNLPLP
ncbi:MAG TPA: PQQ-dependent sugar dehydrogenase [Thermoanaerobaculia bacterium]|jgi:glucose/arabinose dehydrogenase|nr:PQQ-dependent sugar dehydrogenase [Thermoanaerobaculia bacterium]